MKGCVMIVSWLLYTFFAKAQKSLFDTYPVYKGADLGLTYTKKHSTFRIWAPTAQKAQVIFYNRGDGNQVTGQFDMNKSVDGTWTITINRNLEGTFYVFKVLINGNWSNEVPDPYARGRLYV